MNNDQKDVFWNWLNKGFEKLGYTIITVNEDKNRVYYRLQDMQTLELSYIIEILKDDLMNRAPREIRDYEAKRILGGM